MSSPECPQSLIEIIDLAMKAYDKKKDKKRSIQQKETVKVLQSLYQLYHYTNYI